MLSQSNVVASQCTLVFPDGASTHSIGGTISFGQNAQILDSHDNILATTSISKNAGSSKNTCNSVDCVATGTPSEQAASVSFETTTSTVDVAVAFKDDVEIGGIENPGYEFNDINPGSASQASITFSDVNSEYFVDRLVMGFKNTLYLQAGSTYWINQLTLGSQADIIILGTGTARVYVNQSITFPSNGLTNSPSIKNSGDASKLVMHAFSDVTLNSNNTFSGSLYTQGDLTLISSSYIFGAASSANIQLDKNSTITHQSAEIEDSDFGNLCDPPPPQCTATTGTINAVGIKIDSGGSDSQIDNTTEAQAIHAAWLAAGSPESGLIDGGTYNVAASGSSEIDRIDFGGSEHDYTGTLPYPGAGSGVGDINFLVHSSGTLSLPAGDYTIYVESDDGFSFVMDTLSGDSVSFSKFGSSSGGEDNELRFENPTGNSNTGGSFTLNQNSVFDISAIFFERGGGDFLEISIANGINSAAAPTGYEILREGALNDKVKLGRCPKSVLLEYHFDELSWDGTSGEVIDNTSFNHHGTAQGALTTSNNSPAISGVIGTCSYGEFDGIDDYVAMGDPDSLNITGEITLAAWIRPNGTSEHMNIIAHGLRVNPDQEVIFRIFDGQYQVGIWDGSDHIASSTIPAGDIGSGNWIHLAGTYDGATWRLYRNGVELSSTTDPNGAISVSADWAIGANGSGTDSFFEGSIDEPRIYSEALTASDISELMNETRTCPHPPAPVCGIDGNSLFAVGIKINNSGSDSQINTTTEALAIHAAWLATGSPVSGLIDGGTYNVAASGTSEVERIDFGGSEHDFSGTLPYPGTGVSGSDFLVHTSGTLTLPAGDYTIFVESDDGFSFAMETLSGDTVSFNKFGNSSSGQSNELRFENPTGNSNTGGSFTLSKNSVFDIAAIFYERGGGDYLEISIANEIRTNYAPSGYEILRHGALNEKVKFGQCPDTFQVDHYRIEHDTQGFTCKPETLTIKACADENCETLYDQETSISLSPSGWDGGDSLVFTGELTTTLRVTEETTFTLTKTAASPDENLRCFNGSTETCDMTFSNDGFEIFGANNGDPLPDQLAADNFLNVNIRAVRGVDNVCEALLVGPQELTLSYNCDAPDKCLTSLNNINIVGEGTGENSGNIEVEFDEQGVASLALLNYADAGRIILSVAANIEGVTFDNSDLEPVDVYPSYLDLNVVETELLYSGAGKQNNYVAGDNFTLVIGAYGVNDQLLPNYLAENPQLKVQRVSPSGSGENGIFKYSDLGFRTASSSAVFSNAPGLNFSDGEHRFSLANYTEVGRIEIDVQDADYLGNEIAFDGALTLGDFYPAYFDVALTNIPTLADTCNNTFSYLGQAINFDTAPEFTLTAYNALGTKTLNYSDAYWNYSPVKPTLTHLSFNDDSTYASDSSASVINLGDIPVIANNDNYDASGTVTINNGSFRYNKVDPANNSVIAPVSPFEAQISLAFSSDFFVSTFVDQNGVEDTICYQSSHTDSTCLGWNIDGVTGTQMRYGRLVLESTYGPETESLNVPIKAEYFNAEQWLLNTDDSNCTSIDFTEENHEIQLSDTSFANAFNSVTSAGVLIQGIAVGNQFTLDAPNATGEFDIWLDPKAVDAIWPTYLNYDWNGDGVINANDFPKANVSFGLFRGNDKIIHWREVFN
jgi:MSHA biogenesis protein MshQ